MRMHIPPLKLRRIAHRHLSEFFDEHDEREFKQAIKLLCGYFKLPMPDVTWCERIRWGRVIGLTFEDGTIFLVHPENWKRGRKYNSQEQWINAVFHELAHFIFWADCERKADLFAKRMEVGL